MPSRITLKLVCQYPNGDNDGGLMVLVGAHKISKEYHDHFRALGEDRGFRCLMPYTSHNKADEFLLR